MRAAWRAKKRKADTTGICTTKGCGRPIERGRKCHDCAKKCNDYMRARRERLIAQGLCGDCGKHPLASRGECERCYLRRTAQRYLGTEKHWGLLKDKLIAQDYICPYTGITLVIGKNAVIDHIVPRAKGGPDTLDNLQWVHVWINKMKHDTLHDKFVEQLREFFVQAGPRIMPPAGS
jgi:5-methylcytosine-specific restriction endonuclease McrA